MDPPDRLAEGDRSSSGSGAATDPVAAPPERPTEVDPAADGFGPALVAVRDLPTRQRDAVAYRHILGFSVPDAASLMGCTEEAVRASAYQGLRTLKEQELKERAIWTND